MLRRSRRPPCLIFLLFSIVFVRRRLGGKLWRNTRTGEISLEDPSDREKGVEEMTPDEKRAHEAKEKFRALKATQGGGGGVKKKPGGGGGRGRGRR